MIEKLQRRFALSKQGAKDLIKGCIACAIQNISFMIPAGLLYGFVCELMATGVDTQRAVLYIIGCIICLCLIFIATWFQYNGTYLATYVESGVRRVSLAEKLRKIPLSFFGKKDLSDLTSSIMGDCAMLETTFSHYVPALAGSIISSILISVCLFIIDFRMAIATVWVLPIAFYIVGFSSRVQNIINSKQMRAKIAVEDGVQECIETLRDLKSNNAECDYLHGLIKKIRFYEKRHIKTELVLAIFVVSSSLILKIGMATVALVGSALLIADELSVPTFFYVFTCCFKNL